MATIAASVQANPQASDLAKSWNMNIAETISTVTPICRDVANLVAQYLPPIDGWITEWTGERGREVVVHALTQADTPLTHGLVNLVAGYCQKSDVFGLEQLEKAVGNGEREKGKAELTKLLGKYNPQQPLPLEIDDEMQKDLGEIFSKEALGKIPHGIKVTELYSLYWSPAAMTANISEQIAKKHGQKFDPHAWKAALQEHGGTPTSADCWIQFPNDVFGRSKSGREQEALTPAGFEFPHFSDAVFCIFMKYVSTGRWIMSEKPWTYTRCQEKTNRYSLVVGGFGSGRLRVHNGNYMDANFGFAVVRKFY